MHFVEKYMTLIKYIITLLITLNFQCDTIVVQFKISFSHCKHKKRNLNYF